MKRQGIDTNKPKEALGFISQSNCDVYLYVVIAGHVKIQWFHDDTTKKSVNEIHIAYDSERYYPIENLEIIVECVAKDDKEEIKKLLKQYDPTTIDNLREIFYQNRENTCTLLYFAARSGNISLVESLFELFPKIKPTGPQIPVGSTPLHVAFWYGHTEVAQYLLEHGADPNETNYSQEIATTKGDKLDEGTKNKLDEILKQYYAPKSPQVEKINPGEVEQNNLMDKLCQLLQQVNTLHVKEANELINILVTMKPPPLFHQIRQAGAQIASPFYLACRSGSLDIVQNMHEQCTSRGITLKMDGPQDNHNNTPLHVANYRGHLDIVVFLLGNGVLIETNNDAEPGKGKEKFPSNGSREHNFKAKVLQDMLVRNNVAFYSKIKPMNTFHQIEKIPDAKLAEFKYLDYVFKLPTNSILQSFLSAGVTHSSLDFVSLEVSSFLDISVKKYLCSGEKMWDETFTYEGKKYRFKKGNAFSLDNDPLTILKNATPYSCELKGKLVTIPQSIVTKLKKKKQSSYTIREGSYFSFKTTTINLLEKNGKVSATCDEMDLKVYDEDAFEKLSRISFKYIPPELNRFTIQEMSKNEQQVQNIQKLSTIFFGRKPEIKFIMDPTCLNTFREQKAKIQLKYSNSILRFHIVYTKYLWSPARPTANSTRFYFSSDARYFMKSNNAPQTLYLYKVIVGIPFQTTKKFKDGEALPPLPRFNDMEELTFDSYLHYDGKYWFYCVTELSRILPCYQISLK
eukprot:TRINITY_DN2504_c0_g2_i1.p1 TRINITY_DN2504_c0_g2~~TRINITY_DN2504_c0_g2_i1.p1  ORF type:complete len:803 (+),score=177.32 TRINITY_DN2504_c0_g2_i1:187-2409(+)